MPDMEPSINTTANEPSGNSTEWDNVGDPNWEARVDAQEAVNDAAAEQAATIAENINQSIEMPAPADPNAPTEIINETADVTVAETGTAAGEPNTDTDNTNAAPASDEAIIAANTTIVDGTPTISGAVIEGTSITETNAETTPKSSLEQIDHLIERYEKTNTDNDPNAARKVNNVISLLHDAYDTIENSDPATSLKKVFQDYEAKFDRITARVKQKADEARQNHYAEMANLAHELADYFDDQAAPKPETSATAETETSSAAAPTASAETPAPSEAANSPAPEAQTPATPASETSATAAPTAPAAPETLPGNEIG